jgi:hypothetical protein
MARRARLALLRLDHRQAVRQFALARPIRHGDGMAVRLQNGEAAAMSEIVPRFCAICDKLLTGQPQRVLCDTCAAMLNDCETQREASQ